MTKVEDLSNVEMSELDWIQLRKDMGPPGEGFGDKFIRKVKENPVVPVGRFQQKFVFFILEKLFSRMSCDCRCSWVWNI